MSEGIERFWNLPDVLKRDGKTRRKPRRCVLWEKLIGGGVLFSQFDGRKHAQGLKFNRVRD